MKPIIRLLIIILLTVLSNQYENDVKPPSVKTLAITSITSISASSGGYITSDGGAEVTAREYVGVLMQILRLQIQKPMMVTEQVCLIVQLQD
jgi:hypothetical protein